MAGHYNEYEFRCPVCGGPLFVRIPKAKRESWDSAMVCPHCDETNTRIVKIDFGTASYLCMPTAFARNGDTF